MSTMKYSARITLYNSYFDLNNRLTAKSILNIFQDIASIHAEEIGVGYLAMLEKNMYWVLSRIKFDIIKMPEINQTVIAETWPHEKGRVDYDRDYLIESLDGKPLVKASSKWCVINFKTRRIALGGGVEYPEGEYFPQINYEGGLKKIADFDISDCGKFVGFAGESSLDHNGHVNNAKYLEFILDAISIEKGEKIKAIEINYINELTVGCYEIYYKKEGNNRLIKGLSQGKESFRAIFEIEKE